MPGSWDISGNHYWTCEWIMLHCLEPFHGFPFVKTMFMPSSWFLHLSIACFSGVSVLTSVLQPLGLFFTSLGEHAFLRMYASIINLISIWKTSLVFFALLTSSHALGLILEALCLCLYPHSSSVSRLFSWPVKSYHIPIRESVQETRAASNE